MPAPPSHDWDTLTAAIVGCRRCPRLAAWREEVAQKRRRAYRDQEYWGKPVPGFGDHRARVLVVGLAPGAHGANRTGRMFTGDSSGDFLYGALHRAAFASQPHSRHRGDGLALYDAFISAACRCAPPANMPASSELAACRPYLVQEIALLENLHVIVVLGQIAFQAISRLYVIGEPRIPRSTAAPNPPKGGPCFRHGGIYPLGANQPWLVASYHPSRQNTQTGRLTAAMFNSVWTQVRELLDRADSPRGITTGTRRATEPPASSGL